MSAGALLLITVGNTNTVFCLFSPPGSYAVLGSVATPRFLKATELRADVLPGRVTRVIQRADVPVMICSVVPAIVRPLRAALRQVRPRLDVVVAGQDIPFPVSCAYRNPRRMGHDRLATAVAVQCYYKTPAIIIDCGTAITITALNRAGSVRGGVIFPGFRLQAQSLHDHTAQLPLVALKNKPPFLANTTADGIAGGIIWGVGLSIAGFIARYQTILGRNAVVVATGGSASLLRYSHLRGVIYDPLLVFKGLEKTHFLMKKRENKIKTALKIKK